MIRSEYPRPQLVREKWLNLNGEWKFAFDDENIGKKERWYLNNQKLDKRIQVPFAFQTKLSGINECTPHERVWYQKEFFQEKIENKKYLLHFGAVDYFSDIYVNNQHVYHHEGGHTSFTIDVTEELLSGQNRLTVFAYDPLRDEAIPRGKQFWEAESRSIWYTNTTGIWQTVWIEEVNNCYLKQLKITPYLDGGKAEIKARISDIQETATIEYQINFKEELIAAGIVNVINGIVDFSVDLFSETIFRHNHHGAGMTWSPENPNLFDVNLKVKDHNEDIVDSVDSYFGLRKIHQENGMVYLNNKPYYQKLVLDQGYWPESLLTAPNDEAFIQDIKLAKEMGFNGCRKHQKTEDPRFLYWADQLGYLVWGECAAAPFYTTDAVNRLMSEWAEIVERDYNHPCIVTWVPLNESWGIPDVQRNRQQQHFSQTMFHYLHAIDPTRLVISNDGWAMTETDVCAVHNYAHGREDEVKKYQHFVENIKTKESILELPSTSWNIYADGFEHKGEPIILTEFGGIGFDVSGQPGWGYTSVETEEEYTKDYQRIMDGIYASEILWGYCYTQLSDVEQEINGILTYDRKPKCDLSIIKKINDGYHLPTIKG